MAVSNSMVSVPSPSRAPSGAAAHARPAMEGAATRAAPAINRPSAVRRVTGGNICRLSSAKPVATGDRERACTSGARCANQNAINRRVLFRFRSNGESRCNRIAKVALLAGAAFVTTGAAPRWRPKAYTEVGFRARRQIRRPCPCQCRRSALSGRCAPRRFRAALDQCRLSGLSAACRAGEDCRGDARRRSGAFPLHHDVQHGGLWHARMDAGAPSARSTRRWRAALSG